MTLTAPLANAHAATAAVAGTPLFNTIALLIDTKGGVATWANTGTTLQPHSPPRALRCRSGAGSGSRAPPAARSATRSSSTRARTRRS